MNEIYSFYSELHDAVGNSKWLFNLSHSSKYLFISQVNWLNAWNVWILSTFNNNKAPGNYGLTTEFYKFFRPEIGSLLVTVDSLNYAYPHWELSTTQKQAVIILIEKKDKGRRLIKNWRPIFQVNVDVKIGSKAIAKRLMKVLPHFIYYDQ